MLKINGNQTDYNKLFIYDGETIVYSTVRPYELEIEIDGIEIRSARKLNFKKNDCFEIKSDSNKAVNNGKDLYIPASIISVKSVKEIEVVRSIFYGETNYKDEYTLELHCNAHRWVRHIEAVDDLGPKTPLSEYDADGIWSSNYSKTCTTYDVNGSGAVFKRWLTYEEVTEIVIESDYYTRTEKTEERLELEKIADIMSECTHRHISHYDVKSMMGKLTINIKTDK